MAGDAPGPIPVEALAFFRSKGLKPSFDYRDVFGDEHAAAFTIAKMTQLDLLQTVKDSLASALQNGQTYRDWAKQITPTLQQAGWWGSKQVTDTVHGGEKQAILGTPTRLQTIYNTNMRSARAAGQWQRVERTKQTIPYLLYQLGPSKVHREQHVHWNNTLLPVDDPFWKQHTPPLGYGCKCWLRQVGKQEHGELTAPDSKSGVKTSRPADADKKVEWINKRTGEVMQVPVGVTPGFDHNPGLVSRTASLNQALADKLKSTDTLLAQAAATSLVESAAFAHFLAKPEGSFPVGVLTPEIAGRIKAPNAAALLSAETLAKQQAAHPELTLAEYRLLPSLLHEGTVIQQNDQRLAFFRQNGRLYKAVLKTTANRSESYIVSLYRADEGELRRDLGRGKLIRQGDVK